MLLRNAALKKQLQKAEVSGQSTSALAKQIAEPLGRSYGAYFGPFGEEVLQNASKTYSAVPAGRFSRGLRVECSPLRREHVCFPSIFCSLALKALSGRYAAAVKRLGPFSH